MTTLEDAKFERLCKILSSIGASLDAIKLMLLLLLLFEALR